jgi:hypothetical protein
MTATNAKRKNTEPTHTLSRQTLAMRWECSIETVKRREKAGVLKSYRLGGLVRYKLSDVERIEQQAEVSL